MNGPEIQIYCCVSYSRGAGENILVSVIEYGEPKLVEKLLVGVVPTQRILSALLEYSYYDIFDSMWKQFYNRGNNTRV